MRERSAEYWSLRFGFSHTGPLGDGAKHRNGKNYSRPMTNEEKARTWVVSKQMRRRRHAEFLLLWRYDEPVAHREARRCRSGDKKNLNTQWGNAEDNASMLVRYDDAMASIETSWTTYHDLVPVNCPMVYGTKGAMTTAQIDGKDCVKSNSAGWGRRILLSAGAGISVSGYRLRVCP